METTGMGTRNVLLLLLLLLLLCCITVQRTQMRHIVTDQVAWSVSLSVTLVSPAKMAASIEMPFGLRISVGPGNHVLDWGPNPPRRFL